MSMFQSFIMGGYECGNYTNSRGETVNLLRETEHDARAEEDYRELAELDIKTAREGLCWAAIETAPYVYDFTEVKNRIQAAEKNGIQLVWDICHTVLPEGLSISHEDYSKRFTALCDAFATLHNEVATQELYFIPFNGSIMHESGPDSRLNISNAVLSGIRKIKESSVRCKIILCESANPGSKIDYHFADVVAGRTHAELSGSIEYFDIIGLNISPPQYASGGDESKRKGSGVAKLLQEAYGRYNKPVMIAATGASGDTRAEWIEAMTQECVTALNNGVDLTGMCIVPVLDAPSREGSYSNFGIWNLDSSKNRIPYLPVVNAIFDSQKIISYCLNNGPVDQVEKELAELTHSYKEFKSFRNESI